ncbi:MAG TPA: hypothetical protein VK892_19645 [Pyrinomonadaceae bacterium]|nr:hypothetical protein [Pyrinomonadaceae bacterium]
MRKTIQQFIYLTLITAFISSVSFVQAQVRAYRVTDRQVQVLLTRIEQRTDNYKRQMETALDRSVLDNSDREDAIMSYIMEFENATDRLKQNFDARRSVTADAQEVLDRAAFINSVMARNRLTPASQNQWNMLRADLSTLAQYYNVRWVWSTRMPTITTTRTTTSTAIPYRVNDNVVQNLLTRIETRTDTYKRTLNNSLDRGRLNNTRNEDSIMRYVTDFENATDRLKQRFDARESVASDVENVLSRASFIDSFMRDNNLTPAAQNQWNTLKADLDTLATYYSVSWNWNNTIRTMPDDRTTTGTYRVADRQVQTLMTSLEQRTDTFTRDLNASLNRSFLYNSRSGETLLNYVKEFENATDRLKQNFDARRSTSADVEEVLNRAYFIDTFMRDYRFDTNTERSWQSVRSELDTLSNYYNVSWNWENRQYIPASGFDTMMTGTYRLNTRESDVVSQVVDRSLGNYQANQRDRIRTNLERRLQSPEMMAIEKRGNQVTVASSLSPQITFDADGTARTETTGNGRSISVRANTTYEGVGIAYEGDRMNDFYVNFMPVNNGRQLRVVRRVYLENRNETITVASVYDKIEQTANWSMVTNRNDTYAGNTNYGNTGKFVIPNGTQVTAVLTTPLSTKDTQDGDRFQMEVRSPSQFDGAIIEGRVLKAQSSGQVSGRANISLDFESIRLRNGQTYRFAGIIDNVRAANGDNISVNNEGTVRDSNQTTKTATRAGIGAAVGAIIGAIAGGGQGAAIGAAIGAGVGGGSVLVTGRDQIELGQGSEFVITSSAPNNISNRFNQ